MLSRLDFMLDIIRRIGEFQHAHFRTGLDFESKDPGIGWIVSFVDKESERIFSEALKQFFPEDYIIGEETYDPKYNYKKHEKIWIIDPLDGTLLYKRWITNYGVMIAYVEKDKVQCSAILIPETNELFHADKNGAYRNNKKIGVTTTATLLESLVSMSNWSLLELTQNDSKIATIIQTLRYNFEPYSCASNFSLCASGLTDGWFVYPKYGNIWDTVPGWFLIQQAGWKVTNFWSNSWDIFNPNVIFSNGLIHAEFQKLLES